MRSQLPLWRQAQAEGEGGWFRQLRHHALLHQPVVGLQAIDAHGSRVQHQPQRVLVVQQRQPITAQLLLQAAGLLQSASQSPQATLRLPFAEAGFTGGQQQGTGAGGLQPADAALNRVGIDPVALQPEHRRLGQAGG